MNIKWHEPDTRRQLPQGLLYTEYENIKFTKSERIMAMSNGSLGGNGTHLSKGAMFQRVSFCAALHRDYSNVLCISK